MPIPNVTVADVQNMSEEEVATLNKELTRKVVRRIAVTIVGTLAATVAIAYLSNKLNDDTETEETTTVES